MQATDAGLSLAAQKLLAATWQVGTVIMVKWVSPDAPGIICEWTNGKVLEKPTNDTAVVSYPGQGDVTFDFPVAVADGKVLSATIMVVAVRASMRTTALLQSSAINVLDISQWGPYLRDRISVSLLVHALKEVFSMVPEPDVTTKPGRISARKSHFFEKLSLMDVLQCWCLCYLGPLPAFNQVPNRSVAMTILSRLDAFKTELTGGNISQYMAAVRNAQDPKELKDFRKAAMAKNVSGDSDPES
jgi:hypothetical protein